MSIIFKPNIDEEMSINLSHVSMCWEGHSDKIPSIILLFASGKHKVYLHYDTEEERNKDYNRMTKMMKNELNLLNE